MSGIVCEICDVGMEVIRTTARGGQLILRRRKCPQCGARMTTREQPYRGSATSSSQLRELSELMDVRRIPAVPAQQN